MWERAAQAAPTKLPSKIIKRELKPDSVLVMDSKRQKPAGSSWILPAAHGAAGIQAGKKLHEKGLFDDSQDDDDGDGDDDDDEHNHDDEDDDDDDDGDGDDSAFFYGPIRDEAHVQS